MEIENLAKRKVIRELKSHRRKTDMTRKWRHVRFVGDVQSTPAAVVHDTRTGINAVRARKKCLSIFLDVLGICCVNSRKTESLRLLGPK